MSVSPQRTHEGIWLPESGPIVVPPGSIVAEEFPRLAIDPVRKDYTRVAFREGFPVTDVIRMALEVGGLPWDTRLHIVDFASLRKPDADVAKLTALDNGAHHEAVGSDGFLLYFRGDADPDGFNRSWCAWRSAQEAYYATHHKPAHLAAMAAVDEMYDWYEVTVQEMWLNDSLSTGYDSRLIKQVSTGALPIASGPAAP